jgi:hypothetical protein
MTGFRIFTAKIVPCQKLGDLPHDSRASPVFSLLTLKIVQKIRPRDLVPLEGLEPPHLSIADFESAASTIPPQGRTNGHLSNA